jgi:flotillin
MGGGMAEFSDDPVGIVIIMTGLVMVFLLTIAIYASRYQRVPPNKVLVVYGRKREERYTITDPDGRSRTMTRIVGQRFIAGGGTFVAPIIERAGWLSLESTTLELKLPAIKTKNGGTIGVELTAQVKLKGDADSLRTASEQFLDKPHSEVAEAAQKILEARVQSALSSMTLDEINADRKATEAKLAEAISEEFQRSGLALSVLVLKDIHVENDGNNIVSDEDINVGDLFKVVKNSRGELMVKKVTRGVEG